MLEWVTYASLKIGSNNLFKRINSLSGTSFKKSSVSTNARAVSSTQPSMRFMQSSTSVLWQTILSRESRVCFFVVAMSSSNLASLNKTKKNTQLESERKQKKTLFGLYFENSKCPSQSKGKQCQ